MPKRCCLLLLFIFLSIALSAQRPRIGVALSGGGAKGLAHIGILKAIDSAGVQVDYITGTSMGSIVGSLYAIGYSADSIEGIARGIDWGELLTNKTSLRALIMEEKDEYGKYPVELPWERRGFRLPTGVLESQELWVKLTELFLPVWNQKDFNGFSIPFACVATKIESGEAVVLHRGELLTGVRASMAIPTVFTAIEIDSVVLIDGGWVRNFPAQDARDLGADFVIGSSVSTPLLPQEKVTGASQVLQQIVFFPSAEGYQREAKSCDIYLRHPIEPYTSASFNRSKEILEIGLEQGRRLYPTLRRLRDSLDALYGPQVTRGDRLPRFDSVYIRDWEIRGLKNTTPDFFRFMMDFHTGRYYTAEGLTNLIRQGYGTRYYQRIIFSLQPMPDGSARIVFDVVENPLTVAKAGIHYNTFSGISLPVNLTSRNLVFGHSRSSVTLNIGENFRARGEHIQWLGRGYQFAFIPSIQYETAQFIRYNDRFLDDGLWRRHDVFSDIRFQFSSRRSYTLGLGLRSEMVRFNPSIASSRFDPKGNLDFNTAYHFLQINTLDRSALPRRGARFQAEIGYVFGHDAELSYRQGERVLRLDSADIRFDPYPRINLQLETYRPLGKKWTWMTQAQAGINFNYRQYFFNDFVVGGLTRQYRYQAPFAGLPEGSLYASSLASVQVGLRYQVVNDVYVSLRSNALVHGFLDPNNQPLRPGWLSGHALSLAYDSVLGPLEVSLMYGDQSGQFYAYLNLGIPF